MGRHDWNFRLPWEIGERPEPSFEERPRPVDTSQEQYDDCTDPTQQHWESPEHYFERLSKLRTRNNEQ